MWLLSTDRAELHYFARNFDAAGGYAILSHTWVGKEQTLQEVRSIVERCRANGTNPRDNPELSPKICNCCILAEKNGYHWVWIDSCCIDKTSSSELSESINSMYRWYKEAEICYAYLADVLHDCTLHSPDSAFRKSRWHTRGWTLQELIAPDLLIFLSADWHELGNRSALAELLSKISCIPVGILTGVYKPGHYSVCVRMFWASSRKTTRVEDEAYSLMGLFGVTMPTNYGEGKKAFIHLQHEIMQHSSDMSLFAFGYRAKQDDHSLTFHPQDKVNHPWKYLMAASPRDLDYAFDYIPNLRGGENPQYPPPVDSMVTGPFDSIELPSTTVTSYGIRFRLPIYEADGIMIAVMLCQGNGCHFSLFLMRDGEGRDPVRPHYFAGCVYFQAGMGSATYATHMVDLGDDFHSLFFNGKRVEATWRTIYVVPTAPDLDYENRTTPSLILNCNPASQFRIPRWLIARLTNLQFEINQIRDTNALQVIMILHRRNGDTSIFVSLGCCTEHCSSDKHLHLWGKVDVTFLTTMNTFTHNCSEDHLNSESWTTRSKVFGDADHRVRLSFMPSMRMSESVFEVHLELFGHVFEEIIGESGGLFPSLVDLEKDTPHPTVPISKDPITSSRPLSPSQIESTASQNSLS